MNKQIIPAKRIAFTLSTEAADAKQNEQNTKNKRNWENTRVQRFFYRGRRGDSPRPEFFPLETAVAIIGPS